MKQNSNKYFFLVAILLILADQVTKLYFKGFNLFGIEHYGYNYGESVEILGDFLSWTYIENPGMAFGIKFGEGKILLSLFSVFAAVGLVWLLNKIKNSHLGVRIGFTLVLAGAVGNLIDRVFYGVIFGDGELFYGKVVDFIQVNIPDISIDFLGIYYTHWPIFNIADSCVSCGVVLLIIFNAKIPDWNQIMNKKSDIEGSNLIIDSENLTDNTENKLNSER